VRVFVTGGASVGTYCQEPTNQLGDSNTHERADDRAGEEKSRADPPGSTLVDFPRKTSTSMRPQTPRVDSQRQSRCSEAGSGGVGPREGRRAERLQRALADDNEKKSTAKKQDSREDRATSRRGSVVRNLDPRSVQYGHAKFQKL